MTIFCQIFDRVPARRAKPGRRVNFRYDLTQQNPVTLRATLCEAVGRIGSGKCRKALAQAAKDKEGLVRKAAEVALSRPDEK